MRHLLAYMATFSLLGILSGCGGENSDLPARAPAEVKVTYQGAPVEGAHVAFAPAAAGGKAAFGTTDASGVAKLSTFGENDGAVPGEYKVTIRKTKTEGGASPVDPNNPAAMPANAESLKPAETVDLLPAKYGSAAKSGLTATVVEGTDNSFDFSLAD